MHDFCEEGQTKRTTIFDRGILEHARLAWCGIAIAAGAAIVGGVIASDSSRKAANTAADASMNAANTSAESQNQALNYLREVEAVPQQFRQEALQKLGGLSGLEGGEGSQQELINRAEKSPLYAAIMGGRKAGESAILRNASVTGGLRSGNVQGDMYDFNVDLKTKALLESYNQQLSGLQGLAQLPSNANNIASTMSGIGETRAQGIVAGGQIQQQNIQNQGDIWGKALSSSITGYANKGVV